jgi:hypothetical protein
LTLDKRVLKIGKRPVRHRSFLSQEMVSHEIWTSGHQRKHNYKQRFPWRKMQSNSHPNEWVQYTFQPQSMVQSRRDQDKARTSIVLDQLLKIPSPESITS